MISAYKCQDRRQFLKLWNNPWIPANSENLEQKIVLVFSFVQKSQPCMNNGQRHGCTMSFETIVTVLVTLCAQLVLSAINLNHLMLSLEITPNVEPGLSGFIAKHKNQIRKKWKRVVPKPVQLQIHRFAPLQVIQITFIRFCPLFFGKSISSLRWRVNWSWNEPVRVADVNK